MSPAVHRFLRYTAVGLITFGVDLTLLFIFIDLFLVPPVIASGVSFLIAVTLNYVVSRRYVFSQTKRDIKTGYGNFLVIVLVGLGVVMGGMYLLVTILGFNYLISRLFVASLTGVWNYMMNLYINFKVVGEH